ncbi:hypothetical protein B0T25DRAFT_587475 [Lasiosphaeria hispida]|uniref:Uncharacterized protein n=1 Tax=Lasiosphaeria hispida TaxID=260671 RepID=A0AAJ0HVQ7_9PEZI|nr:hypothetical protein B0T25DRAFT_587475 [Lasiosphaeria hispida]
MDPDAPFILGDGFELDYGTPRLAVPSISTPASGRSRSPVAQSQQRADRELPLLQLDDWDPCVDHEPTPTCIHYSIEWKLQLRKGILSTLTEITEENLMLAPSAYWDRFLKHMLAARVQDKLSESRHQPDETKISWGAVEDKLRAWRHLFWEGKKLRINICFIYKETNGNTLRTHDDVPEDIRQLLREQEELLAELDLVIPKPRDEALMRYCQWHCNQVRSPTWKQGFVHAYQVTKEACLDLNHVYKAQDVGFYTEQHVKLGIARSFVGDVYLWAKDV